jgi:hypothetical protein
MRKPGRRCRCRTCPYLNNIVEQDHRGIKRRVECQPRFSIVRWSLADDSRLRGSAYDPERPSDVVAERRCPWADPVHPGNPRIEKLNNDRRVGGWILFRRHHCFCNTTLEKVKSWLITLPECRAQRQLCRVAAVQTPMNGLWHVKTRHSPGRDIVPKAMHPLERNSSAGLASTTFGT